MGNSLKKSPLPEHQVWQAKKVSSPEAFLKRRPKCGITDTYEDQLRELYLLRNPKLRYAPPDPAGWTKFLAAYQKGRKLKACGSWFYFPWLDKLAHFLPEAEHLEVRTGRNRNLVTKTEQEKFYQSSVGLMGMSVGSHAALTLVMTGGAKRIKLADPDTISASNLNRIRSGFLSLGLPKTTAVARQIMEINPYSEIAVFPSGINDQNIKEFFLSPKIDLLVEETDNPYLKLQSRVWAKTCRIPVIMAADNGDNTIVDIERYDLKKNLPILHGILGRLKAEDLKNIVPRDLPKVIAKIAGANFSTLRMLESVREVGKSLYSWPQLGTAATLCGSVLANMARKILTGQKVSSGRFDINIDEFFAPLTKAEKTRREQLLKSMGL